MSTYYKSTRNTDLKVTASFAILQGLSEEGGLFVPDKIPPLNKELQEYADMTYKEVAFDIMRDYLSDFTDEELWECINGAYDEKFDTREIAPIMEADGAFFLELYHGKTIAFKDMALSILPYLMKMAAKKQNEDKEIVILTATSGDTGKAAMSGFADVEGTKIVVFYPKSGVSPLQEKQMTTQKGNNIKVIGIKGNFDEAQSGVKAMFKDKTLAAKMAQAKMRFSSANSINIGRLVPQIVYYVYAYSRLLKAEVIEDGDMINITVPTGNFGNILAAYYAKSMGLPVHKLICASNSNKVLFDFFETHIYDTDREFYVTSSPSMDILISSNLERLIFKITGESQEKTVALMEDLAKKGKFEIDEDMKEGLSDFFGGYATEEDTRNVICRIFNKDRYLIDPHTAVAAHVYEIYCDETGDTIPTIIASTASPYKFTEAVAASIGIETKDVEDMELAEILQEKSGAVIPNAVEEIRNAPIIHDTVCDVSKMSEELEKFLGI